MHKKNIFLIAFFILAFFVGNNICFGITDMPQAILDEEHPRAMWVWKLNPVDNLIDRQKLFDFCKHAAISTLYIYMPAIDSDKTDKLAQFLKQAHEVNIKVEALDGATAWAFKNGHGECLNWIKQILEYNKSRPANERFDGISLDTEPYVTPQWQSNRQGVCDDFLSLLKKTRELIDSYNQNVRLGAAVPTLYADIDDGVFEKAIFDYVDYVALMDYYDNARRITEEGKKHLEIADIMNKKVVVGVETQDLIALNQGERSFTFFEEGWAEMERALGQVKEEFKNHPSFEGFAIHCDYSYMALQNGRNAPTAQRTENYILKSQKRTKDISVDGNLSDWDISQPFIVDKKSNVVYGNIDWQGPQDLSFKVWSVWDDDNIYFSFYVKDDNIAQVKTGKDMWTSDHIELWFDADLAGDYNEAVNSQDDFQFGFSPGDFNGMPGEVYIWIPESVSDYKTEAGIAASKTDDGYIIEVKIHKTLFTNTLESLRVKSLFTKGAKFGVSIEASDTDQVSKPQETLISSSVTRKWGNPTTFGTLELE